jgi:aryl-alcohol dehydrogenase-like predicted oxidoreductase
MGKRVCLGCANFGGFGSNPDLIGRGDSEANARKVMDQAWDLGIRWFDTADAYASGASESIIGRWMKATRKRPRLTTKTFNPMTQNGDKGLSAARIERQLLGSLERLQVRHVDLYLAHEFDAVTPVEETVDCLDRCKARGDIAAYGASNFDSEQLSAYSSSSIELLQNSYSLLDRKDEDRLFGQCAEAGVAYQAYSPLAGGWLTAKYRLAARPPARSRLAVKPDPYPGLDDEQVHDAVSQLEAEAGMRDVSAAGLALAWVLSDTRVASVVIGPRRPDHFLALQEALSLRLDDGERRRLADVFRFVPRAHQPRFLVREW